MNKKLGCLGGLLVLGGVAALLAVLAGIPAGMKAADLVSKTLDGQRLSGSVTLVTEENRFEGEFYRCRLSGEPYTCLCVQGESVYFHGSSLYFPNGRGYDISALYDWFPLLREADPLWLVGLGFRREHQGGRDRYLASLEGSRLTLLQKLFPEQKSHLRYCEGTSLELIATDGNLTELILSGDDFSLRAEFSGETEQCIPPEVLLSMKGREPEDISVLTPLVNAFVTLTRSEVFGAEVSLEAECGILPIRDTAQLYATDDALFLIRGEKTISPEIENTGNLIIGLFLSLCRDGNLESPDADTLHCRLPVDGAVLESALLQILPELDGLGITLEQAFMDVTISNGILSGLTLECPGQMPFLVTTIPMEFRVSLVPMEGTVRLPGSIK